MVEYGPEIRLFPQDKRRGPITLVTNGFREVLSTLDGHGQIPIAIENRHPGSRGRTFIPSDQRIFHRVQNRWLWICREQSDLWKQIAHGAYEQKDLVLWDLGRRLGHQMEVCEWRLLQVSNAYRDQLQAVVAQDRLPEVGGRFEDGHTWRSYLAVQSFLVDGCILRDYLAEFVAQYVAQSSVGGGVRIDSMGSLYKQVLKNGVFTDPILRTLATETREGGWLQILGAYRDLVVHCAPLARSESKLMATLKTTEVRGHGLIYNVSLPLPSDPAAIQAARKGGDRLQHLEDQLQSMMSASQGASPSCDALMYSYTVLGSLGTLSSRLIKRSPVQPTIPIVDMKDIISIDVSHD